MSPAIAIACFILNIVPVTGCDPAGQWYVRQAEQIPPAHLAMVKSITIWDRDHGYAEWPSMRVKLPKKAWDRTSLAHEVGHVVAARLDLNRPYVRAFWRDGKPIGRTTDYGRTNHFEDTAECYAAIVVGDPGACGPERVSWLRERAFKGTPLGGA